MRCGKMNKKLIVFVVVLSGLYIGFAAFACIKIYFDDKDMSDIDLIAAYDSDKYITKTTDFSDFDDNNKKNETSSNKENKEDNTKKEEVKNEVDEANKYCSDNKIKLARKVQDFETNVTYYQETNKISDFGYCFYDEVNVDILYIAENKESNAVYAYDIKNDILYRTNESHNLYTESNVSYLNAYLYGTSLLKDVKSNGKVILVSEKTNVLNYTPSDTMEFVFANCIKGETCTSTTYLFNNKEYSEVERYIVNFKTQSYTKVAN